MYCRSNWVNIMKFAHKSLQIRRKTEIRHLKWIFCNCNSSTHCSILYKILITGTSYQNRSLTTVILSILWNFHSFCLKFCSFCPLSLIFFSNSSLLLIFFTHFSPPTPSLTYSPSFPSPHLIIRRIRGNHRSTEFLQGKHKISLQRICQQRFIEKAPKIGQNCVFKMFKKLKFKPKPEPRRVLIMLNQLRYIVRGKHRRIVNIKAEPVIFLWKWSKFLLKSPNFTQKLQIFPDYSNPIPSSVQKSTNLLYSCM